MAYFMKVRGSVALHHVATNACLQDHIGVYEAMEMDQGGSR